MFHRYRIKAIRFNFFPIVSLIFIFFGMAAAQAQAPAGPASFVNPIIGTANLGNTFPGAVLPFGMVSWSPEELPASSSDRFPPGGYAYAETMVRGFSLTHLSGAGCSGSGDFIFMPIASEIKASPASDVRNSVFTSELQHSQEHASAGYYRVRLQNGVLVELSATLRTGAARFTYPAGEAATLLIRSAENEVGSTDSHVTIDAHRRIVRGALSSGDFCWSADPPKSVVTPYYTIYFAAHFDRPFKSYGTWQDNAVRAGSSSAEGGTSLVTPHTSSYRSPERGSGAYLSFDDAAGSAVEARVGISYVSEENAEANLQAEDPDGISFDTVRTRAYAAWNTALSRIVAKGGTREQNTIFYTALYHSLLQMNLASDVNGQYRGLDQTTHLVTKPQTAQYANFSGWDIYRSQVQLVTLLYPAVASDMAQSLLNQAKQWGCWSRWTHNSGATSVMNGDPSAPSIAAIYAFGGRNFDAKTAYQSLLKAAAVPYGGHDCSRPRLAQWLSLHYTTAAPVGSDTSVADTLELSTADFAISQLAAAFGDKENEAVFLRRAQYWKNLFNPAATPQEGYLQSRNIDGSWKAFDPAGPEGFREGTGAQYLWMVPFNEQALFEKMGGDEKASQRLDAFFHDAKGGWILAGDGTHPGLQNEPSLETPWLYDFSGEPYKTQQTVRAVLNTLWNTTPGGIPGNDDLGEMSSWYVWAALGMYPEIPGRSELMLTSPLFPEAIVRMPGGSIHVIARPAGQSSFYIQSLQVNGHAWQRPWLPSVFAREGGTLSYTLATEPNKRWGAAPQNRPPSFDIP